MDIFGVSDYTSSPECIACLTDPRDTILLPCRHLCVCSDCFDRLTLDRCPVCRAPFTSYLRFTDPAPDDDADADFICPEAAPAEAQSETSEAPSNEPFLPPEPSGSTYQGKGTGGSGARGRGARVGGRPGAADRDRLPEAAVRLRRP